MKQFSNFAVRVLGISTFLFLNANLSSAFNVTVQVEAISGISLSNSTAVVRGNSLSDPSGPTVELGAYAVSFQSLPNGNSQVMFQMPSESLDGIFQLHVMGIEDGCYYGVVPVPSPLTSFIFGYFEDKCPKVVLENQFVVGPRTTTGSSGHVGNSNQSKNNAIQSFVNLLFGPSLLCIGTCWNGANKCLAVDMKIPPSSDPGPPPPGVSDSLSFDDVTGNGIPDTYNYSRTVPAGAVSYFNIEVKCDCVDPAAPN